MNKIIKSFLKKIPYASIVAEYLLQKYEYFKLNRMSTKDVFSHIYRNNTWGDPDSVSGAGSNFKETATLIEKLPELFREHLISSVLDIPCGDFYWMNNLALEKLEYIGADIVPELVERNKRYERSNIRFEELDLVKDLLPRVDLIFVRDCLVHLSYHDIFKALENILKSDPQYLLTTTFTERTRNHDIATGQWRALNLQISPFEFPEPLVIISEEHPKKEYRDKSLGLWKVADIRDFVCSFR